MQGDKLVIRSDEPTGRTSGSGKDSKSPPLTGEDGEKQGKRRNSPPSPVTPEAEVEDGMEKMAKNLLDFMDEPGSVNGGRQPILRGRGPHPLPPVGTRKEDMGGSDADPQ
eukprot:262858-Rhodomonas_salina.1